MIQWDFSRFTSCSCAVEITIWGYTFSLTSSLPALLAVFLCLPYARVLSLHPCAQQAPSYLSGLHLYITVSPWDQTFLTTLLKRRALSHHPPSPFPLRPWLQAVITGLSVSRLLSLVSHKNVSPPRARTCSVSLIPAPLPSRKMPNHDRCSISICWVNEFVFKNIQATWFPLVVFQSTPW